MAVPTVTITGKVLGPDGRPLQRGALFVRLSHPGSAADGGVQQRVAASRKVRLLPDGSLPAGFALVPNDLITPGGTFLDVAVEGFTSDGEPTRWEERWQLASSPNPVSVGAVPRLDTVPALAVTPVSHATIQAILNAIAKPPGYQAQPGEWWIRVDNLVDGTPPTVTAFVVPATSDSLTVPITTLTATDAIGVTGYLVTESATPPAAGAPGWTAQAPASVTAGGQGARTFYAWAKDAAGNVSAALTASCTVTLADQVAPVVSGVSAGAPAGGSVVLTITATDNVAVTGYLGTLSATPPLASDPGWQVGNAVTVSGLQVGANEVYGWARDAAGNVSAVGAATHTSVVGSDSTAPTITAFTIPATSSSLTVPITALTATDNVGVTAYIVQESATPPLAGDGRWGAAPTQFVFSSLGAKTLRAFARDAAGNVSSAATASVTISAIFSDTFATDRLATDYTTLSGAFTVSAGKLRNAVAQDDQVLLANHADVADVDVTAVITPASGARSGGIIMRCDGTLNNRVLAYIDGGTNVVAICDWIGGVFALRGTLTTGGWTVNSGQAYTLRARLVGANVQVWVDGVSFGTQGSIGQTGAGRCGVQPVGAGAANEVTWDDFSVQEA